MSPLFIRNKTKMYTTRLVMEAACVGAVVAVALLVGQFLNPVDRIQTLLYGFMLGMLIHLGFEVTGLNTYYCRHGAACRV